MPLSLLQRHPLGYLQTLNYNLYYHFCININIYIYILFYNSIRPLCVATDILYAFLWLTILNGADFWGSAYITSILKNHAKACFPVRSYFRRNRVSKCLGPERTGGGKFLAFSGTIGEGGGRDKDIRIGGDAAHNVYVGGRGGHLVY